MRISIGRILGPDTPFVPTTGASTGLVASAPTSPSGAPPGTPIAFQPSEPTGTPIALQPSAPSGATPRFRSPPTAASDVGGGFMIPSPSLFLAPNTTAPASPSAPATTQTGGSSSGSTDGGSSTGDLVNRLLDLASMQYASGAPTSGATPLISTPIDGTGDATTSSTSGSGGIGIVVLVGIVALVGYFIYKHHKQKKGTKESERKGGE